MTIATDEFRRRGVSDEYLFHSATSEFRCVLLPMSSDATVPVMSSDSTVPPTSSELIARALGPGLGRTSARDC